MKVFGLAASVLTGAMLLAVPGESQAATRLGIGIFIGHDSRYDRGYGYSRDTFRVGYSRGYEDGADRGRHDGRNNDRFDFWREGKYRCGDAGYRRSYGPKERYVAGYRDGYEQGYRRAYAASQRHDRGHYGRGYDNDRYRGDDRYRSDDRYDHDR
jgi:hypothetical protein